MNLNNSITDIVRVVLPLKAQLTEGMFWEAETQSLWGVDIHGHQLWQWDTVSITPKAWAMPQRIGWILPTSSPDLILLGLQQGFALGKRSNPTLIHFIHCPFENSQSMRLNDAKADITGTVWAGSLNNDDESSCDGSLFKLTSSGNLSIVDEGYTVPNGPAISPCSSWMLHTDSGKRTIYAFDLDHQAGALSNKRIWKTFAVEEGYPDGMCFDAEGAIWIAHWGAGLVSRFAANGSLLQRFQFPVSNITNVCFGGKNLERLFVSTASTGLSANQLEQQPFASSLFEIMEPGTKGLPGCVAGIQ